MEDLLSPIVNDQWTLVTVVAVLLLTLAEVGYRFGRRSYAAGDDARRSQISVVQASILGILGLLLGFTFSMAVARYDHRREVVVKEANAIGTTWLRASLLPEAHRRPVRDLLREYVDVRLRAQAVGRDPVALAEQLQRGAAIQSSLWRHAENSAIEAPNPITATFVVTLNELIDTDAERIATTRGQIPAEVWLILLVVAGVSCFTSAYSSGSYGTRSPFTSAVIPLLISIVILMIFDLTHERQGAIGISQQPLIELQHALRADSGSPESPAPR